MKAIAAAVIILLFGLAPPAFAKDREDIQMEGILPKISIPESVYNFGTVPEGNKVVHTFAVENTGGSPLTIMKIKTTCGCTAADYTKEKIMPGERGEVTLQFNSNGYGGGSVKKAAYVYSNDPKSSKITLRILGDVARVAEITPASIKLHGSPRETVRETVEIIPSEDFPFHIVGEPETGKDTYKCTIEEKGGKYILTAENLAKKPMVYFDNVVLKTDRPEKPEIRIRVSGRIGAK